MKLATAHPFNDEHGTAANGTAQLGGGLGISCTVVCTKQSTAAYEHIATPAVGEKAEVADADQALGQKMDHEVIDKELILVVSLKTNKNSKDVTPPRPMCPQNIELTIGQRYDKEQDGR